MLLLNCCCCHMNVLHSPFICPAAPHTHHLPAPTLLQESELTPTGSNLLDGRYAVFGYVTEGAPLLAEMQASCCHGLVPAVVKGLLARLVAGVEASACAAVV